MNRIISLGQRIRKLRLFLKEPQQAFARKLDIGNSTLSKYEKGLRKPDPDFFIKIKEITGVDLNWLIVGEGEMFLLDIGVITGNRELAKQIGKHAGEIQLLLGRFKEFSGSE